MADGIITIQRPTTNLIRLPFSFSVIDSPLKNTFHLRILVKFATFMSSLFYFMDVSDNTSAGSQVLITPRRFLIILITAPFLK